MACSQPIRIKAKRKIEGVVRVQGHQMVPCGKCNACRQRRINDWVLRLQAEEKSFIGGLFVTLTYSPENVRLTNKGLMTVTKRDVQLFLKRLRFNTKKKIKYYAAAEYGSKSFRPHYHLILFGANRNDVDSAWGLGDIHVGHVTGQSCAYTLKYISKEKLIPQFATDDRIPEFSLMSKNLGASYITPQTVRYHKDNGSFVVKEGGFKAALPRYYRDRIFTQDEKDLLSCEQQKRALEAYDRAVLECGGEQEYYRRMGERARLEAKKLKEKRIKENLKI